MWKVKETKVMIHREMLQLTVTYNVGK